MKKVITTLSLIAFAIGLQAQTVTIGTGTRVDSNLGLSAPISIFYGYSISQQLYTATEIGQPMTIKTIQFYLKPSTANVYDKTGQIDIWMGHTTQNALQASTATGAQWIPIAQQTKVLTSGSMSVSNDIATFTLNTPFVYNGTDNLIITVDENTTGNNGNSHPFYQTEDGPNIVTFVNRSDTTNPDPSNPPTTYGSTTSTDQVQSKVYKAILTLSSNVLSTSEISTEKDFKIFKSDNGSSLTILSGNAINNVELYDAKGGIVSNSKLIDKSLAIEHLPAGVYTVKVNFKDGKTAVKKFVK